MLEKHRSTLVAGGRCGVRWGQCEHQLRLKEEDDVFGQLPSSLFESYSPKDKGARQSACMFRVVQKDHQMSLLKLDWFSCS